MFTYTFEMRRYCRPSYTLAVTAGFRSAALSIAHEVVISDPRGTGFLLVCTELVADYAGGAN